MYTHTRKYIGDTLGNAPRLPGTLSTSLEWDGEIAHSETKHVTRDDSVRIADKQIRAT